MWTTESQTTNACLQINCAGNNYNVGNLSGLPLVEKIRSIARENQFQKYDIIDSNGENIQPAEVERGEFVGPLTIVRFNVAAA